MQLDSEMNKIQRELELEQESVEMGITKYQNQVKKSNLSDLPPGVSLMYHCLEPFKEAIRQFKLPQAGGGRLAHTRKFFLMFSNDELAYIAAKRLINAVSGELRKNHAGIAKPAPVQSVAISLVNMLIDHLEYRKFKDEHPGFLYKVEENLKTTNQGHRRRVIMRAKRLCGVGDEEWSNIDKLHFGVRLIDLFIESTGLVERVQMGNDMYVLTGTEEVLKWVEDQHARCELMNPMYMPMIVKPVPWTSVYGGGFLSNASTLSLKFIRTRNDEIQEELEEHEMPLVYRAVNAVQDTPWRINKRVLEVMKEVWNSGGCLGDLPYRDEEPLPATPWQDDDEFKRLKELNPEVIKDWKIKATKVYDKRVRDRSKRIGMYTKLMLADKFKDEPEIFFVWTLDWRGRMYPVQSYINPQADDSGKALIEFAEGKPLGERGIYWLKVHLANEFGVDKVSFEERVKWVEENEHFIVDSALNPLDGHRFWCEADSPYQFLAACFEFQGALDCLEGSGFISHLPVALDGSCNGLQNFSAMLRDEVGGKATNLVPQDTPQDIYAEVAKVLEKMVEEDALTAGDENAKVWVGKINRKITKRGVMTTPYGAKLFGLKDQLMTELSKLDEQQAHYLEVEDNYKPCLYLGERLYEAIGEVVIAARQAMDWLQEVAKVASKAGVAVKWTTPSGFLVHQEYIQQQLTQIATYWGGLRLRLGLNLDNGKLDKKKQSNGISPNFVHSMDASHLALTINKCLDAGICYFSMIHDSYATHACNTDKLAELLRESFIEMYSTDVLERFRDEVQAQLPVGVVLPEVPPKGRLNLDEVRQSRYFFA